MPTFSSPSTFPRPPFLIPVLDLSPSSPPEAVLEDDDPFLKEGSVSLVPYTDSSESSSSVLEEDSYIWEEKEKPRSVSDEEDEVSIMVEDDRDEDVDYLPETMDSSSPEEMMVYSQQPVFVDYEDQEEENVSQVEDDMENLDSSNHEKEQSSQGNTESSQENIEEPQEVTVEDSEEAGDLDEGEEDDNSHDDGTQHTQLEDAFFETNRVGKSEAILVDGLLYRY